MTLHETLWESHRNLVEACLGHPFVEGLREGSLPVEVFDRFVGQDAHFLEDHVQTLRAAASRWRGAEEAALFARLEGGALEELRAQRRRARRRGVTLSGLEPETATLAYERFLSRLAREGELEELLAALVPCARLYVSIGRQLAKSVDGPGGHPYAEWIRSYADPALEALAGELEGLLDRLGSPSPAVREAHRRALAHELALFDAVLRPPDPGD